EMQGTELKACRSTPARIAAALGMLFFCLRCPAANADFVELTGGGSLEGKLLPADDANKLNCTIELAAGGRVTIARSRVAKIESLTDAAAHSQYAHKTSHD